MACGQTSSAGSRPTINVMFLCDEWKSCKGGLSTFNREFAVNLAKTASDSIKVYCYVSQSDELSKEDARQHGVELITAQNIPGSVDPLDWLKLPPPELPNPDIVVGHGRKFGTPAYFIVRTAKCKWMHFVHVYCEDLGKFKATQSSAVDTIEENEKKHKSEIELCKAADVVVAVGSRLQRKYNNCLPFVNVEIITPGIFEKFSIKSSQLAKDKLVKKKFSVFMFGRGSFEDFTLKGYDIVANAIGSLENMFELTFVGSSSGEHRKIEQWFLDHTSISRKQLTIRGYCNEQEELTEMFHEPDMVAIPSRTEGFGLVALEAISAGIPVLVAGETGIAEALLEVEGGKSIIVESDDPKEWARRIQQLSRQSSEQRENNAKLLRDNYAKTHPWRSQCKRFERMIQDLAESLNALKLSIDAKIVTPAEQTTQDRARVSTGESGESHISGYQEASAVPVSSGPTQSSCTGTEADPQAELKLQTLISEEEYIACMMHSEKDPAQAGENDDFNPPNDLRELSVIPTQEDILTGERPFLRRNKIDGSYHDAEHYFSDERNRGGFRGRGGARGGWRGSGRGGGRGGRGSAGSSGNPRPVKLGFKALQDLDTKTPDEIILDVTSSRCFPATESLLTEQTFMRDDFIVLIVSILSKACDCNTKEYLLKLLNLLPNSVFFNLHLRSHLNRLSASRMPPSGIAVFLRNAIKIMNELLRRFPNSYADLPVSDLYFSTTSLSAEGQLEDVSLVKDVEELMKVRSEKAEELKKKEDEKQHRRRPRRDAGENDDVNPLNDFRELSVIPTQEDILTGERPFLRRNKIDGSYHDAEHYLDVQFRLLREDFVRPLREGIAQLLERIGSTRIGALQDIRVYEDIRLLYPVCTSNGLHYKVQFDNAKLRHIRWENCNRLIFGSLMCLSKDKFESFVFATVANRDLKELKQGKVDIQFIKMSDNVRLEEGDVYQMVESTVYFEAYRHVLEGLKEVEPQKLPLQNYIVNCQKHVEAPAYLRNRLRGRVTFDLTPIMKKGNKNSTGSTSTLMEMRLRLASLNIRDNARSGTDVPLLSLASWPSAEDLELDDSQFRALQMALTKEFAVIHGPPGTGKTYIGLKIANVLLHNKLKWDTGTEFPGDDDDEAPAVPQRRPILVVCYTNHALDRFLEGIHKFHPEGIVRIGGRSEIMKTCSLSELKHQMHQEKSVPRHIRRAFYDAHSEMDHTTSKLQAAAQDLKKCLENVLHEDDLNKRASSMTDAHYQSLKQIFAGAIGHKDSAMLHWLQLSMNLENPGQASVQPVAVFPLNKRCGGLELTSRANLATLSRGVTWATESDDIHNNPLQLRGTPDSFVEIPNRPDSFIDTRTSITLLMDIFPTGNRGSILSFQEAGMGLQICQDGVVDGEGVLTVRFARRDLAQPPALTKAVLKMNAWNFIGASYDHDSGIARLWHDGNEVEAKYSGRKLELATQFSIRIGALDVRAQRCFQGRVTDLHIFAESLGKETVRAFGGIVSNDGAAAEEEEAEEEEEEEDENPDVLYEADVMQDQRILDIDDVKVFGSKAVPGKGGKLRIVNPFAFKGVTEAGFQIQKPKRLEKKLKRIMVFELSRKDVMSDERANAVKNVWHLSLKDRWRLYRRWLMDVAEEYRRTISLFQVQFEEGARRLKDIKDMEDFEIIKKADVVGMTTTGAAKYRKLLQRLRPRITIVQEAAEVLESHIVTSLTPGCQHLILIGDHQQLRPNPTVYELAEHYNLDVSLFERMVRNGMPFERLRLQHRMRPEISKMLEHIYVNPKLENHESVMNFDNIKGVARNMFFVDHAESEDFTEEGESMSNEHEAKFIAALCRYFILQGYQREQITVLTAYTGQLIQLKKEMPKDFFRGVRVCAVDNFQGEENDIILLSLVRSNEEGKIGFLQTENRVCVALSRAKKGFFCIGNISLLETKSKLWNDIVDDMREQGNVGEALMLTCQNHPQNVIHASRAEDFKKAPEGGCTVPCATRLECGHVCDVVCHPTDPEHKEYKCNKPCAKTLCARNHMCSRRCYQECGPCMELVPKRLPLCGHIQKVPCFKDPSEVKCLSPCLKILPRCGHQCRNLCSEECSVKCTAKTKKSWPCGHANETECHVNPLLTPCKAPCGVTLKCEHPCSGDCFRCLRGRVHVPCKASCDRTLFCGHSCSEPCTKNCPPCKNYCGNYCKHSKCTKKCGEPCDRCNEKCIWRCRHHKCTKLCGEVCNRQRCNVPCTKLLPCKHPCIGLCGEECPKKCRECDKDEVTEIFFGTEEEPDARFVELADCGHVFEVEMMDQWMDQAETTPDGKPVDVQLKLCPKCRVPIRTSLRYGNIITKILADFERIKQKILLGKGRRDQETARLRLKVEKIDKFPKDKEDIIRSLDRKNLTDEQVNVVENQISFLTFFQQLMVDIAKGEEAEKAAAKSYESIFLLQETKEDLESKVKQLRKRVMEYRVRFSDQELEELNEEMHRTQLLIDFRMLKMQLDIRGTKLGVTDTVKVDFVKRDLDSEKTIDKVHRNRYTALIKRIRKERNLQVSYLAVTREEKDLIVKAMGLTQGHWFKCPKGHIYCITECGGAMEESKCPECGSRIGGYNHQLLPDNQLASEMDGARYAAFSDMANIHNFDPREFQF